jgi:chitin disaccharide deacetylase
MKTDPNRHPDRVFTSHRGAGGEIALIIHADDLGVARSVNSATFAALSSGFVTAASVMVPCPHFHEVAEYAVGHPDADIGIHLTLTNEWKTCRWGSVAPKERVTSLLDEDGYLWRDVYHAVCRARPQEVEIELCEQIETAMRAGIKPTHLDTHMFVLWRRPAFVRVLTRVAHRYSLPFLAVESVFRMSSRTIQSSDLVLEKVCGIQPGIPPDDWQHEYSRMLFSIKPGWSQLNVHLGYDDAELREITSAHPNWGAAWRERDFDVVSSMEFRNLVDRLGIKRRGWRDANAAWSRSKLSIAN